MKPKKKKMFVAQNVEPKKPNVLPKRKKSLQKRERKWVLLYFDESHNWNDQIFNLLAAEQLPIIEEECEDEDEDDFFTSN